MCIAVAQQILLTFPGLEFFYNLTLRIKYATKGVNKNGITFPSEI